MVTPLSQGNSSYFGGSKRLGHERWIQNFGTEDGLIVALTRRG
jgi:hypothetical protein